MKPVSKMPPLLGYVYRNGLESCTAVLSEVVRLGETRFLTTGHANACSKPMMTSDI
jgi:hypothetical protein